MRAGAAWISMPRLFGNMRCVQQSFLDALVFFTGTRIALASRFL